MVKDLRDIVTSPQPITRRFTPVMLSSVCDGPILGKYIPKLKDLSFGE